jgi:Tol biopolymer transport system component
MARRFLVGVWMAVALVLAAAPAAQALKSYWAAPFAEASHTPAFGQAPVFVPHTDPQLVVFGKDYKTGDKNQVYIQRYDGQGPATCLTCSGPGAETDNVNGVPVVSPDGRWIIFHSWRGHELTIGSPGYGGMGSALWAMHIDGSAQTQLTDAQPPTAGPGNGEGIDDYHAYWSPDGTHIEYAHLNWNFITGGGKGNWDVRVAEFHVAADGTPFLANTNVVRPDNGHWYETQWWNPNPRTPGFLFTETYPTPDGSGAATTPQLFYCQLIEHFKACKNGGTRLSNSPSWDEQAIFTPDSKSVIFMSSRDHPGFFDTWAQTARTLGLPNDYDYLLILPLFEAGFLQPVGQESTDLYELRLAYPEQVRRLTHDGDQGWITPEFTWDPTNSFLMWTENRFPDGYRYPLPVELAEYAQHAQTLLESPPGPGIVDIGQNGIGVAPLPLEQRTQTGTFQR